MCFSSLVLIIILCCPHRSKDLENRLKLTLSYLAVASLKELTGGSGGEEPACGCEGGAQWQRGPALRTQATCNHNNYPLSSVPVVKKKTPVGYIALGIAQPKVNRHQATQHQV